MLNAELVGKFAEIFSGLNRACGRLKADGDIWCEKTEPTLQQYERHLTGRDINDSLGIYPLMDDGNVYFAVEDSDNHKKGVGGDELAMNVANLRDKLWECGIVSYIEVSKSGKGYHVWVFFDEPVPAALARKLLRIAWVEAVGGTVPEIFPKQDRLEDKTKFGNFIHLPYFPPSVKNNRRVITDGGNILTLEQFIKTVRRHTLEELGNALAMLPAEKEQLPTPKERTTRSTGFKDLLPCAKKFMGQGAGDGPRRPALFRLAAHMNRAGYPYEIALAAVRLADEKNSPPIIEQFGPDELEHHVKSAYGGKNGAGYVSLGCDEADWTSRFCDGKENCSVHSKPTAVEDFSGYELNWDGTIINDEIGPNSEETASAQNSNKQPAIITNNRFLGEITGQALKALAAGNCPEVLFTRGGAIVKVSKIQQKDKRNQSFTRPAIKLVSESSLRGYLARSAQYVLAREKSGETKYYPTSPPLDLVRDIMALDNLPLPLLCGIVQAPVMRYDGSMFTKPGYDTVTSLYYSPEPGFSLPYIPDKPTNIEIKNALDRLCDVVIDFPFDSEASWANILAAIITPVLRDLIAGPVPLLLIDKPLQGTGASLLSDVISIIATGEHAHMTTAPEGRNREEEWRKRVTAILGEGRPITVIDNIEETFRSATLCALLTSTNWSDRLLGRNELVNLQHRTCWIATGNNIRLAGDLPRRCYKVRMDANQARPWQRGTNSFRHPHLIQHVKAHRGELLASIYTIARAWILAGRPPAVAATAMGSFEEWREVIGGMLEFAGVKGFLGNVAEIYESAEVNEGIEDLIELWFKELGEKQITAKQIQRFITWESKWQDVLPDWLDPHEQGFTRKLGRVLARKAGVYFSNGYKLEKCGVVHQAQLWKVRSVGGV